MLVKEVVEYGFIDVIIEYFIDVVVKVLGIFMYVFGL